MSILEHFNPSSFRWAARPPSVSSEPLPLLTPLFKSKSIWTTVQPDWRDEEGVRGKPHKRTASLSRASAKNRGRSYSFFKNFLLSKIPYPINREKIVLSYETYGRHAKRKGNQRTTSARFLHDFAHFCTIRTNWRNSTGSAETVRFLYSTKRANNQRFT